MIVFDLQCAEGHGFESWFRNSEAFEAQRARALLSCPFCGSTKVSKALMAPAVAAKGNARVDVQGSQERSGEEETSAPTPAVAAPAPVPPTMTPEQMQKAAQVYAMMRAVQSHVEENFDHVGGQFAEEARAIHYGEKENRAIYGQTTPEEAEELQEEGIEVGQMPWLPKVQG